MSQADSGRVQISISSETRSGINQIKPYDSITYDEFLREVLELWANENDEDVPWGED